MITPHHQIHIRDTPNDRFNLTNDPFNHGGLTSGYQVRGDHNSKYNRHNVQESLTTRISKLICAVFLCILFTLGLVTFILWLSLRPHRPRFHIHEFSIPSLAETYGFSSAHITFNMTARNPNINIGIYYDTINLTLYFKDQTIAKTPLLFPFYQSPKNTAIIYGTLLGSELKISTAQWKQLAARKHGDVAFRLDVTSLIRFKVSTWDSRIHKMHANCEIVVGPNGMILPSDKDKKCPVYFT
ncbi:NDR1/HIN1-like protein 26 [Rutidosis leptorrhynchoides]|uniref:NDR1/HIN1-like protein 26 n=1 Tax=Rutidosis leptorrhynchoides TaxID=125765 RepID=UPI003A9938EC